MLKHQQPHKAAITSVPPTNEKTETLSPLCFVFMYTAENRASKMALQWTHPQGSFYSSHLISKGCYVTLDDHKKHLLRFLNVLALHEVIRCEKRKCTETTGLLHRNMWRKKDAWTGVSIFHDLLNTVGIFKDYVWVWAPLSPVSVDSNTGHYITINVRQSPPNKALNHQLLLNKPIPLSFLWFSP